MTTPRYEDIEGVRERLQELVESGDLSAVGELLEEMHPSDVADLVESLGSDDERVALLQVLPVELASETLAEMDEEEDPGEILAALDPQRGAELLHELEVDDAVDLVGDLEPEERAKILAALPLEEAGEIRGLLRYDEESAGGLMDTLLVRVQGDLTAGQAIAEVRRQGREVEDFYTVFVIDEGHHLLGTVPLDDLILADPLQPVVDLVQPVLASVEPDEDQEEVGRLISRYNLPSVPVVDQFGVLLGRVTFDDVLDVFEAEQTEDLLRFVGTSDEEEIRGTWSETVQTRLPWLALNLITATMAASVIWFFKDTVESIILLAVLAPIIAALGGNAGTQALAVTVRRISLAGDGEIGTGPFRPVGKELLVGLVNGAVLGGLIAGISLLVPGGNPALGAVVLLAMWGNLIVAGFAGSFVPTILHRFGADPAVASSVFVHTFTDLIGFFLLLGLATAILL
ncbi:MAG: magnesium transporter [Gemmatimonadetes bacterium]|nr:magnesium transporter [Gemmatimonadota bacterium]NNM04461.1 magnesium transporter [Gemmatimonadota bacterium]